MKPNLLIFCSWLEPSSSIGIFFREQAELVSDCFNPILIVFKENVSAIKKLDYKKKLFILEKRTEKGLTVLEVYYPVNKKYPSFIRDYFKNEAIGYLNSYLARKNITVSFVHAQSIFDAGIWAYHYYKRFNVPYIITEHNQLTFFNVGKEKCEIVKNTLQKAKKVCVVSNDKMRQFVANGLFFDFENVGNLIHEKFYYLPRNENQKKRLVTVGAYSPLKDQITIVKALQAIDSRLTSQIEFVWIGYNGWGGDYHVKIAAIIDKYSFKNINIILLPSLSRDEIVNYLQGSDLFVFSSLSEGMPVSVLEALACGLPVFTSNCGGVDELIDQTNGHIYQIKDYKKLAELLLEFLSGKNNYNNALISKDIINKYGAEAFKARLLNIYQEIL